MAKYIIAGPTGSGITTLLRMLSSKRKFILWKSYTTRKPRSPKCHDKYYFCTLEEFKKMEQNGFFEETEEKLNHWYGTPKLPVDNEDNIICKLDVLSALKLMKFIDKPVTIFMFAPIDDLKTRLIQRDLGDLEARLNDAMHDLDYYVHFQYVIENLDMDQSLEYLINIVDQKFSHNFLNHQGSALLKLSRLTMNTNIL